MVKKLSTTMFMRLALCLMMMCLPLGVWAEEGSWTWIGTKYGICSVTNHKSISYNGLNNTAWGDNSVTHRTDLAGGSQGIEFTGSTSSKDQKIMAISIYQRSYTVPEYTWLHLGCTFQTWMATSRYKHGAGIYFFNDLSTALSTSLDATPEQNQANAENVVCIHKQVDDNGEHTCKETSLFAISLDNRDSDTPKTFTKYIVVVHVACAYDNINQTGNEWAGFVESKCLTDWFYKALLSFNANGGSGGLRGEQVLGTSLDYSFFNASESVYNSPHTLLGWTTNADGTGTFYGKEALFHLSEATKGRHTFYAKWQCQSHSFKKYDVIKQPTCTTEGTEVATCDNHFCDVTDSKPIPTISHVFTNYVYNNDVTCSHLGTKTASCEYGCGTKDTKDDNDHAMQHVTRTWSNGFGKCQYCDIDMCQPLGETNSNGYYEIQNAGQLYSFAQLVNSGGDNLSAKAKLTKDITVNEGTFDIDGNWSEAGTPRSWTPIGNVSCQFQGVFDGNNRTISGLYSNENIDYLGLIGFTNNGAVIQNVGLLNHYFVGGLYVGGICAYNSYSTVSNCYATGMLLSWLNNGIRYATIGGICAGNYYGSASVSNCYFTGTISGTASVAGGICGDCERATISHCYGTGNISSSCKQQRNLGGICGDMLEGTYSDCYSNRNIYGYKDAYYVTVTRCSTKSAASFANGEVAYLLNSSDNSSNDLVWGQILGAEDSPTLRGGGVNSYVRKNITNAWATIVVPFAVKNSDEYCFYTLTSVSGDALTLTKIDDDGSLPAGTPALVYMTGQAKNAESGKYDLNLTASNSAISTAISTPDAIKGLALKGTYAAQDIAAENGYFISGGKFYSIAAQKAKNSSVKINLGAFRAYLAGTLANGAAQLRISISDEELETALEVLGSLSIGEGWGEAYDLNGRPLDDLQPGVNVVKRGNKSEKVIIK